MEFALKGQEALTKIARFQPYCLILDVVLPDISGYAICRYLQQHMPRNTIYIILISAKNAPFDQSYGLSQGAHRYLPKPFTAEALVQMVREGVPIPLHQSIRSTLSSTPQENVPPALLELMPRRLNNSVAMRTSSPFARTPAIEDDRVNQLYAAIDGKKTLSELAAVTGLEAKTVTGAIRALLKEKRIRMYDGAGQPVENAL